MVDLHRHTEDRATTYSSAMTDDVDNTIGGCLCGAIRYQVTEPLRNVLHCHCLNCRKTTGNFMSATGCTTAALQISDADQVLRWHDLGYATYGFCSTCGSSLFWQGAEHQDRTSIHTGSLDDRSELTLESIWFADEASADHLLDAAVPHFSGNGES